MKKLVLILFTIALICNVFAQKKEELVQRIGQLETITSELKQENANLRTTTGNLTNTIENLQTSLKSISESNKSLESKISRQEEVILNQNEIIQQLKAEIEELQKAQVQILKSDTKADTADLSNSIVANTINDEESIISVVQQYSSAKRWEDQLPFVYKPDKVRPLMQKKYTKLFMINPMDNSSISIPKSHYEVGETFIVGGRSEKYGLPMELYMRKTTEGFKVDWEATVGYTENLNFYKESEGTEKKQIRITVDELKSTVAGIWGTDYYFIRVDNVNIYFLKKSAVGKRLAELKKEGIDPDIILEVQGQMKYNPDYQAKKYYIFATRIVREDWFSE